VHQHDKGECRKRRLGGGKAHPSGRVTSAGVSIVSKRRASRRFRLARVGELSLRISVGMSFCAQAASVRSSLAVAAAVAGLEWGSSRHVE
jgi:hypothetical protein